jgi:hypothetical protein
MAIYIYINHVLLMLMYYLVKLFDKTVQKNCPCGEAVDVGRKSSTTRTRLIFLAVTDHSENIGCLILWMILTVNYLIVISAKQY